MKVMLDTNTCIAIIKRKPPDVLRRFADYKVGEIGISWVTLAELEFGVAKSQHQEKNQTALDEFVLPLEIANLDHQAARTYGLIRATLEKKGTPRRFRFRFRNPLLRPFIIMKGMMDERITGNLIGRMEGAVKPDKDDGE